MRLAEHQLATAVKLACYYSFCTQSILAKASILYAYYCMRDQLLIREEMACDMYQLNLASIYVVYVY